MSGGLAHNAQGQKHKNRKALTVTKSLLYEEGGWASSMGGGGDDGGAGATRMGRFNIWHPGTVQPPSYNPPTIVTSNGAPFRPFATSSLPLRRTHWTWNKRDRHIFKRIRLKHKQINESSNTNDWSWHPRQDGQSPVKCEQASAMQHKCSTIDDHLMWYLQMKILNIYAHLPLKNTNIFVFSNKFCQFLRLLVQERWSGFRCSFKRKSLEAGRCKASEAVVKQD